MRTFLGAWIEHIGPKIQTKKKPASEGGRYTCTGNPAEKRRSSAAPLRLNLVAGYGFGGFFFRGGVVVAITVVTVAVGVAIAVGVAVSAGWGDAYWLASVGEIGWDRLGDIAYRADLHYCRLG